MRTLILLLLAAPAFATKQNMTHVTFEDDASSESESYSESNSESDSYSDAFSDASSQVRVDASRRGLSVGGSTAPRVQNELPTCWVPKGKFGRGFRFLFGAAEMSPMAIRDADCIKDLEKERNYAREQLKLELELAREQNRRISLEIKRYQELTK